MVLKFSLVGHSNFLICMMIIWWHCIHMLHCLLSLLLIIILIFVEVSLFHLNVIVITWAWVLILLFLLLASRIININHIVMLLVDVLHHQFFILLRLLCIRMLAISIRLSFKHDTWIDLISFITFHGWNITHSVGVHRVCSELVFFSLMLLLSTLINSIKTTILAILSLHGIIRYETSRHTTYLANVASFVGLSS